MQTPGLFKPNKLCAPRGIQALQRGSWDKSYLARSIFVCALHITVQEWHGKRAEILQGQRRKRDVFYECLLPSIREPHGWSPQVSFQSAHCFTHSNCWQAIPQTLLVLLGLEKMSDVSHKWTGSPQQHLHPITNKNHLHRQRQKSCVKLSRGGYWNPIEKLLGNYSFKHIHLLSKCLSCL